MLIDLLLYLEVSSFLYYSEAVIFQLFVKTVIGRLQALTEKPLNCNALGAYYEPSKITFLVDKYS